MMAMNEYSLADVAAVVDGPGGGNRGDGSWGGDGAWWIILLIALLGGFNGGFGGWGNGGAAGGNELFPWINQSDNVNNGFRDQMLQTNLQGVQQGVNGLSTQLCNCCADMQMAVANGFANVNQGMANGFAGVQQSLCNGFNGVEQGANARQMANMNQQFGMQTAMMQGFNGVQAQTAQLASDIQLGNAQQTATILAENCADRAALSDGVRDIIASQTAGTQRIIDQLCQDKIDAKNDEIAQLRQQLNMQQLAASQAAQNTFIAQGFANEVDALYNRLNTCPVPTTPVYGRTPIFTCQNNGCGCGA